ncbi:hypothetical protein GCM10028797_30220 [Dyella agri]
MRGSREPDIVRARGSGAVADGRVDDPSAYVSPRRRRIVVQLKQSRSLACCEDLCEEVSPGSSRRAQWTAEPFRPAMQKAVPVWLRGPDARGRGGVPPCDAMPFQLCFANSDAAKRRFEGLD